MSLPQFKINNITKLVNYLRHNKVQIQETKSFGMFTFCESASRPLRLQDHECGTCMCAVGYGPAAGIEPEETESWFGYLHRCFVDDLFDIEFVWMFDASWSDFDNTVAGVIQRIDRYLMLGLEDISSDLVSTMFEENDHQLYEKLKQEKLN